MSTRLVPRASSKFQGENGNNVFACLQDGGFFFFFFFSSLSLQGMIMPRSFLLVLLCAVAAQAFHIDLLTHRLLDDSGRERVFHGGTVGWFF